MKISLKALLILTCFLISQQGVFSQSPPSYVSAEKRKLQYPDEKYLTGFASAVIRKTDKVEEVQKTLLENAKTYLVQSISTRISSSATLNTENHNTKTLEIFRQVSTSYAQADLTGLKVNEYYDTKKKEAYAFVHLNIQDFLSSTQNTLILESTQLSKKLGTASQLMKAGNRGEALKTYLDCFPLLREMESQVAIVLTLGKPEIATQYGAFSDSVSRAVSLLRTGPRNSMNDLCFFIADGIKQQIPESFKDRTIRLGSFTYMNTGMGSKFSAHLAASLQPKLTAEGFAIYTPDQSAKDNRFPWVLSGTYWLDGKNLKVIANLNNEKTGITIASIEEFFPLTWLTENGIEYLPGNYQSAIKLEKELSSNEIVNSGLMVKLWTNKGMENPVYKQGEKMQVYVQADQPCYLRLIYFTADGNKWLLKDSWYLDETKINKPYLLPGSYTCTPPFGAEILQLVAQTEPFKKLDTEVSGGNTIILGDDHSAIEITRGMKAEKPNLLIAEKRISITTLEE